MSDIPQVTVENDNISVVISDTEIQVISVGEAGPPGLPSTVPGPPGPPGPQGVPGSIGAAGITTKTADYLIASGDFTILGDATALSIVFTLPATPGTGEIHNVKKIDATANTVTVNGNGNNIDGTATIIIKYKNTNVELQFDGTVWRIL